MGFLDLTSTRQITQAGIGPISILTIYEYCLVNEIEGEQLEDFVWLVTRMDAEYLKLWGKKNGH